MSYVLIVGVIFFSFFIQVSLPPLLRLCSLDLSIQIQGKVDICQITLFFYFTLLYNFLLFENHAYYGVHGKVMR